MSNNLESENNVVYGIGAVEGGSEDLLLDIYQPDSDCSENRPFVIGVHGGGFTGGSKRDPNWVQNLEAVAERGYAGLSINYRLAGLQPVVSPEFQPILDDFVVEANRLGASADEIDRLSAVVAAFEDTVTALEWARANADERCLDTDRFALWGSSAGATTILHVAHALDEYFIDRPEPKVVVDYWGRLLIDGQLNANGPPLLIIHGTNDQTTDYQESAVVLAAEAGPIGLPFSFYSIEGGPHGFGTLNPDRVSINGQTPLDVTVDFIEDHLLGENPLYESQTIVPN
ncbi:MAG: alpha/beta hydrolase fold domain-containing protein [Pseudomonadota bacterium]